MRFAVALLVVALCLQMASGSVLVRFINTVPNTLETPTAFSAADAFTTPHLANGQAASVNNIASTSRAHNLYELGSTRVGLKYYADGATAPATVWTEKNAGFGEAMTVSGISSDTTVSNLLDSADRVTEATFAYQMAMPPLRAYHDWSMGATLPTAVGNSVSIDRVAHFQRCMGGSLNVAGTAITTALSCYGCDRVGGCEDSQEVDQAQTASNAHVDPSVWDTMDHMGLKADGISQYMTFAAGTYKFQAYGIGGSQQFPTATAGSGGTSTTSAASTAVTAVSTASQGAAVIATRSVVGFGTSAKTFTFEDWHVYTIVATGSVTWPSGASTDVVSLSLLDESIAPATFGKATVRYFHAVQPQAANSMSVFDADSNTAFVSNVAFGTASAYVDIKPSTSQISRLSLGTFSEDGLSVTGDLRAGTRATIICAVNDLAVATAFCRQIPSRVVAYVRLVNDYQDVDNHVFGGATSVALKDAKVSLWGSYDYPRPNVLEMGSSDASVHPNPSNPITGTGLYPVIGGTAAGSVTGYGEVHVPLFIMDKATTRNIFMSGNGYATSAGTSTLATAGNVGYGAGLDIVLTTPANAIPGPGISQAVVGITNVNTALALNNFFGYSSDLFQGETCLTFLTGAVVASCPRRFIGEQGYDYAARYKRVNLVVKSDGFATINDFALSNTVAGYALTNNKQFGSHLLSSSVDIPMEPGQFYTFYATVQLKTKFDGPGTLSDGTLITDGHSGTATVPALANHNTAVTLQGDFYTSPSAAGTYNNLAVGSSTETGARARDARSLPGVEDNQDKTDVLHNAVVSGGAWTAASGSLVANPVSGRIIEFGLTLDRHITDLSRESVAGKGTIRFLPFGMVSEAHALLPNGLIGYAQTNTWAQTNGNPYTPLATNPTATGNAQSCDLNAMVYSGVLTATNDFDTATTHAKALMGVVHIRQFHNAYGTFSGHVGYHPSHASPPLSKLPSITIKTPAGVTVQEGINPLSNYVRLDPNVLYMPTLKPMFDSGIANEVVLDAGSYTWVVANTNWRADDCMFTVPAKEIALAEGDYLTVFVLNFYGCRSANTASDTKSKLNTVVAAQTAYMTTAAPAATQETFFGAASSVSASVALLFAGVIAILALAL